MHAEVFSNLGNTFTYHHLHPDILGVTANKAMPKPLKLTQEKVQQATLIGSQPLPVHGD
jgi:hypothetical protein